VRLGQNDATRVTAAGAIFRGSLARAARTALAVAIALGVALGFAVSSSTRLPSTS
jgi:hypothetical protein